MPGREPSCRPRSDANLPSVGLFELPGQPALQVELLAGLTSD